MKLLENNDTSLKMAPVETVPISLPDQSQTQAVAAHAKMAEERKLKKKQSN